MDRTFTSNELIALLEWYREMGVTQAIDEVPTDWRGRGDAAPGKGFAWPSRESEEPPAAAAPVPIPPAPSPVAFEPPREPSAAVTTGAPAATAARRPPPAMTPPPRAFPTAPPDEATLAARAQARQAHSIDALGEILAAFDGCGLKATAKNLCYYRGAARARLMVIGEAPGREEDIAGQPFVGPAGKLLDRMLAAIGESDATVHITNIVYWRPPGNRTPTPQEGQICRPFLERQIELVAPDVILLLGGAAAKHMLDTPEGIMKLRGSWRQVEIAGRSIRTMASLHPAYLLRTPAAKRQAWADLVAVRKALDGAS